MSILHAFFVMLAFAGACGFACLIGDLLQFHEKHRNIRRRSWPRSHGPTYFTDLKRWNFPEDHDE